MWLPLEALQHLRCPPNPALFPLFPRQNSEARNGPAASPSAALPRPQPCQVNLAVPPLSPGRGYPARPGPQLLHRRRPRRPDALPRAEAASGAALGPLCAGLAALGPPGAAGAAPTVRDGLGSGGSAGHSEPRGETRFGGCCGAGGTMEGWCGHLAGSLCRRSPTGRFRGLGLPYGAAPCEGYGHWGSPGEAEAQGGLQGCGVRRVPGLSRGPWSLQSLWRVLG